MTVTEIIKRVFAANGKKGGHSTSAEKRAAAELNLQRARLALRIHRERDVMRQTIM